MKNEATNLYLNRMINELYKILAMKDEEDFTLPKYIDSVYIQLVGGAENFPELKTNQKYVSIINIIQYFRTNEFDKQLCKREILKCTNLLAKLSLKDKEVDYGY